MQDYIKSLLSEPWSMILVMGSLWLIYKLSTVISNIAKDWFVGVNQKLKLLDELVPAVKSLTEMIPRLQDLFENKIKHELRIDNLEKKISKLENRCEECIKRQSNESSI